MKKMDLQTWKNLIHEEIELYIDKLKEHQDKEKTHLNGVLKGIDIGAVCALYQLLETLDGYSNAPNSNYSNESWDACCALYATMNMEYKK